MENEQLEIRKQVWKAISAFYLDTELQEGDYIYLIKVFKKSGLSLIELKAIDLYEVFPILQYNLLGVAGVWDAFEEVWLFEKCLKNHHRRNTQIFRGAVTFMNAFCYWMRKDHWQKIEELWNTNHDL
ncbi:MAG: hypothetical protein DHS20C18_06050 [Saprospiraceae bacterium]|nr:MAG: hypothetical protein DHS20C18_06050 [Saprospiraceae bacterium]